MAIVYSLVCFGGKDGKSVTCSNSGGYLLLTATKNGVRSGLKVYFSGTLPGNIASTSAPYYLRNETIDTCTVYDTQAHAIAGGTTGKVAWSSAGSSVKITSGYWYELPAGSGSTGRARYGQSGSERVYDSQLAARNARYSAAVATDVEVIEFATQFFDHQTSLISLNIPAAEVRLTPTVDEEPTDAAHGGVIAQCTHNGSSLWLPNGYICDQQTYYLYGVVELSGTRHTIEGISFSTDQTNTYAISAPATGLYNKVKRCMLFAYGAAATLRIGLYHRQDTLEFTNNRIYGFTGTNSMGLQVYGYDSGNGSTVANNTVVNCNTGFGSANTGTSPKGWFRNNISLGNTTNWGTTGTGSMHGVGYNAGLSGEAWGSTGRVTMATTDFADFSNYDFRPAAISSPQVDTGVVIIGMDAEDIAQNERPNYVGSTSGTTVTAGAFITGNSYTIVSVGSTSFTSIGASANTVGVTFKATGAGSGTGTALCNEAYDIGADEFDRGLTRPVQRDLVFTGAQTGSQIIVYTTGTTTELQRNNSTSGDETYEAGAAGVVVDYTIYKLGYDPIRVTGVALDAETTTITVQQTVNRAWVASSGLTYTTDLTYTAGTPNILKLRIASTLQNALCCLYEAFIASATNTALKNRAFPAITNGPNSFSLIDTEWRGWSTTGTATANTSLDLLKRDGMRYITAGGTVNATWGAFYTPDTGAGLQVKYRQATAGSIVSALTTGPIDQLIQIQGGASYGAFDYTGHMVMRAPKVGYSQPKPNFVSIYGTLEDQLYVSGLAPVLQWATTNADIDAANLVLDNTAKTYVVSAAHSVAELYQRAQWWANQDAQWDADIPLTSVDGNTYTLATGWTLSGLAYVTGAQTIAGGTITLGGPGTYAPAFSGNTVVAQGEGTYTFTAAATIITFAPTANAVTYVLGGGTFSGTIDLRNTHATRAITVELPSGTSYTTANNTGAAITVTLPQVYQSVAITGIAANYRVQIYDGSVSAPVGSRELYNAVPGATSVTWTDPLPAAANRLIRLRVTADDPDPGEAIVMIDQTIGTCGTSSGSSAVSYLVTEAEDEVYTANNVEGSTVTGITIDDGALLLQIDSGTVVSYGGVDVIEVDVKDIYAYETYWLGTEEGIRDEARFIDAIDGANYEFNSFKLKNTSSPVMPILIVGGYVRDAATGVSASMVDYTGGPIHFAPDHVVNNIVSVGGANIITGDIADISIPNAATNAAAVRTELADELLAVTELHRLASLDDANPLTVTPTSRTAGSIVQSISGAGTDTVVVTRTA